MIKIGLREFANLPETTVLRWLGYYKSVEVTDDHDEKLITDTQSLLLTWQGMIVHRAYNSFPYSVKEVARIFIPGQDLEVCEDKLLARPLNQFLPVVMRDMKDPVEADKIKMMIHIWQAKTNNLLTAMTERFAISVTSDDLIEVMEDPGIVDIKTRVLNGTITIDEGETEFITYMATSPTLSNAMLPLLCRTGGTSYNQAYQSIIVRGAVFDLDNSIFPNPIMDSYAEGVVNLADSLAEKNGAGKALITSGKALQGAEWFHRKNQLHAAVVRSVDHFLDCNTDLPVPLKVKSKEFLHACFGKYAVQEDGSLELIDAAFAKKVEVGDTILIRSIPYCTSKDPSQPCGCCVGQMKHAFPYNTMMQMDCNIGIYSATAVCRPIGQGMLSIKHFLRNTVATPFAVRSQDKDAIRTNGDDIFLLKELCMEGTKLIVSSAVTKELTDIRSLDNLDDVTVDKLSYFDEASLSYLEEDIMIGGKTLYQRSVKTSIPSRSARMSKDLLEFIFDNGWEVIDKKFIAIDLSNWHHEQPLFTLPYTQEDMDIYRREVESFMAHSKRNNQWKEQEVTPARFGEVLVEMWEMLNHKFKGINILHCEVLLYAVMAKNPKHGYYGLVNGHAPRYFVSFQNAIWNRGFGTLMIYDHQQNVLNNFSSFLVKERQPSPFEAYWHYGRRE